MTFEILPRHSDDGIDWGADRKLLARASDGDTLLFWVPGGNYWSGLNGSQYAPAHLNLVSPGNGRTGRILTQGGRLSMQRLLEVKGDLAQYFGIAGTEMILKAYKERRTASLVSLTVYGR